MFIEVLLQSFSYYKIKCKEAKKLKILYLPYLSTNIFKEQYSEWCTIDRYEKASPRASFGPFVDVQF